MAAAALVSIAAILAVYLTPRQDKLIGSNATSFESRQAMWANTIPAIKDHVVLGSGVGSFPRLYPQYEDQAAVSLTFVNHAHNDYIEIALEAGLPGIVLVVSFLMWWGGRAVSAWRTPATDRYAIAGSIASAAILGHSLVHACRCRARSDPPQRTWLCVTHWSTAGFGCVRSPIPPIIRRGTYLCCEAGSVQLRGANVIGGWR